MMTATGTYLRLPPIIPGFQSSHGCSSLDKAFYVIFLCSFIATLI
jgi:hypothetical protein